MPDDTPILSLPLILASQAQKHVTHNEALRLLDVLVQLVVRNRTLTSPPSARDEGDCYIVADDASGDWAGKAKMIAAWWGGAWDYLSPQVGWSAWVINEGLRLVYTGDGWTEENAGGSSGADKFGINTAADNVNRLAVASEATLLTHDGHGHQLKLNKATIGDTVSLLYQTDWSGRAEMGLAGNDGFSIKVSSDGANWTTALTLDPATGQASGAAVAGNRMDTAQGKLIVAEAALHASHAYFGDHYSSSAGKNIDDLQPGEAGLFSTANAGIFPAWGTGFIWISCQRIYSNNAAIEWAVEYKSGGNPGAGRAAYRIRSGSGTWGRWVDLVPESGSNANGAYTRFPDGTLICSGQVTGNIAINQSFAGGVKSAPISWTYPAAFTATPRITATPVEETAFSAITMTRSASVCNVAATAVAAQAAKNVIIDVLATGRWY